MRGAPGHTGGEIETQGRDTAQGHISRRGWCPAIFPITACVMSPRGHSWIPIRTWGGSSAGLDVQQGRDGEFTAGIN